MQSLIARTPSTAPDLAQEAPKSIFQSIAQTAAAELRRGGDTILNLLFRCRHRSMTAPFTPVSKFGKPPGDTYVTCLDCGTHFLYDWTKMRMGSQMPPTPYRPRVQAR